MVTNLFRLKKVSDEETKIWRGIGRTVYPRARVTTYVDTDIITTLENYIFAHLESSQQAVVARVLCAAYDYDSITV